MNSIKQVAETLGVSEKTVRGLVAAGRIEHHRIGIGRGTIRISDLAVESYLGSAKAPTPTTPTKRTRASRQTLRHIKL